MSAVRANPVPFGPFAVLGRLGFGGMGEVFRAERDGRELALKLLRPEYAVDEHFRDMFRNEARVGAFLLHPHIVHFYEVGEVEGMLYLATEIVEGASLDRLLDQGPLPLEVAVRVAGELLDALHYAHELTGADGPLGVVHRDVSTSNVLVTLDGAVKLTDFGLAKISGLSLTLTNEVKGKRAYMAPEQLEGGSMDRRVDIFAMGVLVHELVTGKRPFADVTHWVLGSATLLPSPCEAVIRRALAVSPDERFSTAAEMADALRALSPPSAAASLLVERVRAARAMLRPLNKLDQLVLDELAGAGKPLSRALAAVPDDAPATQVSTRASKPPRSLDRWPLALGGLALLVGVIAFAWPRPRPPMVTELPMEHAPEPAAIAPLIPPPVVATPVPAVRRTPDVAHAPRVTRAQAATGTGFLVLDTDPWATAYLGAQRLGTTPLRVALPAGRQALSLQPKDSKRRQPLVVDISANGEKRVSMRLRP